MRRSVMMLLCGLLLLTTGCWDSSSPEQMAWVSALGVDEGGSGNFRFTFQLVIPRALASTSGQAGGAGGGGQGKGHSIMVFSVDAPDVITATEVADAFVARRVNLQHAKALILGESVVRDGVGRFLAPAIRYREFRRTMYVFVSRGTAQRFLELAEPRLEADPSLWFETLMHWQEETQLVPPIRIHELVTAFERIGVGARVGVVAPRNDVAEGQEEMPEPQPPGLSRGTSPIDLMAGQIPRAGELPVEFMGTAAFRGDKVVGYLTGVETRVVAGLRGEMSRRTPISIPDPRHETQRVVLLFQQQRPPDVRVWRQGSRVHARFQVLMEGDIGSIPSVTNYVTPEGIEELERAAAQYMRGRMEQVLAKTLHEWEIDVLRLDERLKPTFPTIQAWEAFDWSKHIKETRFQVSVQFEIRRHGLQRAPARPMR